ncbi:dipicolinate synthase subunit B [Mycoplasmatota bacterium]|nr:dipicolinate synthase subunit B [Mycoplasmatota bacterium]
MEGNKALKIAIGITGSYGKINDLVPIIKNMLLKKYTIKLFGTTSIKQHPEYVKEIEELVNDKVIYTIEDAEPFGPSKFFDCMLIAPCSGNSLSKLANALTDNAVIMAAKSTLRNCRPVIIGVSSNDALGMNGSNLMKLLVMKNIYFIPFGQDNPEEKPNSLVSDFNKTEDTIRYALMDKQIQPIIIVKNKRVDTR